MRLALVKERLDLGLAIPHAIAALASTLGVVALVLALMGLYGVTSFLVNQRTREIGLRMAIGATVTNVFVMVVRQAIRPVLMGLVVGLAAGLLAGRLLTATVYGVRATDPVAMGFAVSALVLSASVAAIMPARRAARLDPARVLREG